MDLLGCVLLALILILAVLYEHKKRKIHHIKAWQQALNLPCHEQTFQNLFQEINGFILSQQARARCNTFDLTYGEIEFTSFLALLSLTKPDTGTVFYDLGSGVGKAVIACALVYPVKKCVGIELLEPLHAAACSRLDKLLAIPAYKEHAPKIEFILGDFLKVNLDEATFIFINASSLFNPTWEKLCQRLDHLSRLKTVITTSKPLQSVFFTPIAQTDVAMSWGVVQAYIHVRKRIKD